VGLGPSCGLELLPRARARAKLENMVAIAREHAGRDGRSR
jgi:methionine synthase II (cobalamin-independent)